MQKAIKVILAMLITLFWILIMLSFSDFKMALQTLLAAIIHELGHICALVLLNKGFSLPKLVSSGFRIKTDSPLSYKEEIFVCACGPLVNVALFVFFISPFPEFAIINIATAISNLLPIPHYDGYKITSDILSLFKDNELSEKIMPHITILISALTVFVSLFLIFKFNGGYWIFPVFFLILIRRILFFHKLTKNEF